MLEEETLISKRRSIQVRCQFYLSNCWKLFLRNISLRWIMSCFNFEKRDFLNSISTITLKLSIFQEIVKHILVFIDIFLFELISVRNKNHFIWENSLFIWNLCSILHNSGKMPCACRECKLSCLCKFLLCGFNHTIIL